MATIDIKDVAGKTVKSVELNDAVFGIEPNIHVRHTVVRAYRAGLRQGTANTKTRGEVRGGGKKPWRQKGTGRARQGSIRSPQWVGGGTVFGPHTRSYAFRVNRKEVKLAMRSALSAKLADEQLTVVDQFAFEAPRTKDAKASMEALGFDKVRATVVIADDDVNTFLSFRNLENVNIIPVSAANTYELVDNKQLVLTVAALERLEEVLA